MTEETTNPAQTAPAEAAEPAAAAGGRPSVCRAAEQAAAPEPAAASAPARKGSSLMIFLTVLLILVGITDLVLWGVAGYYFLRSF